MIKIDLSYLESVTDGDKELMKELIEIFKSQVPEYVQDYRQALEHKNTETLMKIAHKSKSSVAIMGMQDLANELSIFENEAKKGVFLNKFLDYVNSFDKQCQEAIQQLEEKI